MLTLNINRVYKAGASSGSGRHPENVIGSYRQPAIRNLRCLTAS